MSRNRGDLWRPVHRRVRGGERPVAVRELSPMSSVAYGHQVFSSAGQRTGTALPESAAAGVEAFAGSPTITGCRSVTIIDRS
ncbi:MAG TPA: hypothetical protein VGF84_01665, partial [Micromonosporaceae bacterium]